MRKKTNVDTYTVGDQYATLTYGYNDKGYITSRGDLNTAQYESYTYDALGRLTQVSVDGVQNYYFGYDASLPHAVSSVRATEGSIYYSYCGNNPVMYTDPDGEYFIIDSWILGLIHGFFSTGGNRWQTA